MKLISIIIFVDHPRSSSNYPKAERVDGWQLEYFLVSFLGQKAVFFKLPNLDPKSPVVVTDRCENVYLYFGDIIKLDSNFQMGLVQPPTRKVLDHTLARKNDSPTWCGVIVVVWCYCGGVVLLW